MIPDNIVKVTFLHVTGHFRQMEESLISFCGFRPLMDGQQALELHGQILRIHHGIFRRARMDVPSGESHLGTGGVEILVLDLPYRAAVCGIGVVRAEPGHVKAVRAPADFLIRGKRDTVACRPPRRRISSAAVRISAMPALSSAPSRVVPSVTIRCLPITIPKSRIVTFPKVDSFFGVQA